MNPSDVIAQRNLMPSEAPRIWIPLGILLTLLFLAPALGLKGFMQALVIEILIFSLLALSLNVLVGYVGLVSFGHAAFFAIAGYAIGIIGSAWTTEILVSLPLSILCAALCAIPLGLLSIRLSGFYFLMITFAFAQIVFVAAFRWKWLTGGSDGMSVRGATLFGSPILQSREALYFFVLTIFTLCAVVLYALMKSQFGKILVGIRESTPRMRALGYNVRAYKLSAFVIAATFAGIAGAMNSLFNLFIAPETAHWTQSSHILVMVLIGGTGYFVGPIVGATIVLLLQHWLSSYTEYWGLVLGILFIALITGARSGVAGLSVLAWHRLLRRPL